MNLNTLATLCRKRLLPSLIMATVAVGCTSVSSQDSLSVFTIQARQDANTASSSKQTREVLTQSQTGNALQAQQVSFSSSRSSLQPAAIRSIATYSSLTALSAAPIDKCVTWQRFKAAIESGKLNLGMPLPNLPTEFKNGCLSSDQGAHTIIIFVLKEGISAEPIPLRNLPPDAIYKIVPPLAITEKYDQLYENGQILQISFDFPGVKDLEFRKRHAWQQVHIDSEYHTVVFRNLFMESKGVSLEEMARLLEATKSQWAQN